MCRWFTILYIWHYMAMFHGELLNTEKHAKYWKHIIQWRSLPGPLALAVEHGVIGQQVLAKHTRLGSCCSALATSGFQCYIMFSNSIYIHLCRCICYYIISYYIRLFWTVFNDIILYYVILYYIMSYHIILYYILYIYHIYHI